MEYFLFATYPVHCKDKDMNDSIKLIQFIFHYGKTNVILIVRCPTLVNP